MPTRIKYKGQLRLTGMSLAFEVFSNKLLDKLKF